MQLTYPIYPCSVVTAACWALLGPGTSQLLKQEQIASSCKFEKENTSDLLSPIPTELHPHSFPQEISPGKKNLVGSDG